jgi:hypothetical protein
MTDDEMTLLAIKGMIGELPLEERREFEDLVKKIRSMVKDAKHIGALAIALLGAELQMEDGS